jgi:hypothetical protein
MLSLFKISIPPSVASELDGTILSEMYNNRNNINLFDICNSIKYRNIDDIIGFMSHSGLPETVEIFITSFYLKYIYKFRISPKRFNFVDGVRRHLDEIFENSYLKYNNSNVIEDIIIYKIDGLELNGISRNRGSIDRHLDIQNKINQLIFKNLSSETFVELTFNYYNYSLFMSAIGHGTFKYNLKYIDNILTNRIEDMFLYCRGLSFDPISDVIITWMLDENTNHVSFPVGLESISNDISIVYNMRILGCGEPDLFNIIFRGILEEFASMFCSDVDIFEYPKYVKDVYISMLAITSVLTTDVIQSLKDMSEYVNSNYDSILDEDVYNQIYSLWDDLFQKLVYSIKKSIYRGSPLVNTVQGLYNILTREGISTIEEFRLVLTHYKIHACKASVEKLFIYLRSGEGDIDTILSEHLNRYTLLDTSVSTRLGFLILDRLVPVYEKPEFLDITHMNEINVEIMMKSRKDLPMLVKYQKNKYILPYTQFFIYLLSSLSQKKTSDFIILILQSVIGNITNSDRYPYLTLIKKLIEDPRPELTILVHVHE